MEVGCLEDGTRCATFVFTILCTVLSSWSGHQRQSGRSSWAGHNWGAVAEMEQLGNWGSSWVWPCKTSACQRQYSRRLLVHQSRGLRWTHANVVNARRRDWPLKHTYVHVRSEERTVMCCAVLMQIMEVRWASALRKSCRRRDCSRRQMRGQ